MLKKLTKLQRTAQIDGLRAITSAQDTQNQKSLIEFPVSSEIAIKRVLFDDEVSYEILSHAPDAIDFSRAVGMPLLLQHDPFNQIGVVESLTLRDSRLVAAVRFSSSATAKEIEADVVDMIRRNVSLGYVVSEYQKGVAADGGAVYTATKWMPTEVSIVAVPADHTVGYARSTDITFSVNVVTQTIETETKDSTETATEPTTAATEAPEAVSSGNDTTQTETAPSADSGQDTQPTTTEPTQAIPDSVPDTSYSETRAAEPYNKQDAYAETAAAIRAYAQEQNLSEYAEPILQRKLSIEDAKKELFNLTRSQPLSFKTQKSNNMITAEKLKTYSYARALLLAAGVVSGGVEQEVSDELKRNMPFGVKSNGGILVPTSIRALTTTGVGAGAETVFTQQGEVINALYNRTVAQALGATMYSGLTSPVQFPKIGGGIVAHWVSENPGVDVDGSTLSTGSVTLSPKTLMATTQFSKQLLQQSVVNIDAIVRDELAKQHALAIDRAVLHGTGLNNQPTGIYNTAGVGVVDMTDGVTYGKLVDMVSDVNTANALSGTLGFATTPGLAGKLKQTLQDSGVPGYIWEGRLDDGMVAGYKAVNSNQVSSTLGVANDEHGIIFGNFSDVIIGTFGALEILADPYRLKNQGLIEITSFQQVDIAIRHPESFCKAIGAKLV